MEHRFLAGRVLQSNATTSIALRRRPSAEQGVPFQAARRTWPASLLKEASEAFASDLVDRPIWGRRAHQTFRSIRSAAGSRRSMPGGHHPGCGHPSLWRAENGRPCRSETPLGTRRARVDCPKRSRAGRPVAERPGCAGLPRRGQLPIPAGFERRECEARGGGDTPQLVLCSCSIPNGLASALSQALAARADVRLMPNALLGDASLVGLGRDVD